MLVVNVRNVHQALPWGVHILEKEGIKRNSRNGPVTVIPGPVTTVYSRPTERVLFWALRDTNPWLNFFEALWMLAGRRDVAYLKNLVARMGQFSDDGETFHGAYGYRWRHHFEMEGGGGPGCLPDQIEEIVQRLKRDPDDRRSVLTMWDPLADLGVQSKDLPCNTHIYFGIVQGKLDATVCCRSNDMCLGGYGTNAVHFSVLLEYMAGKIGCPVGRYFQISNNYHMYQNDIERLHPLADEINSSDPYSAGSVVPFDMDIVESFDDDIQALLEDVPCPKIGRSHSKFVTNVAYPMWRAHKAYKDKDYGEALHLIESCQAQDWRKACREWLQRRKDHYDRAKDDGVSYGK